jgi:hypothetical protein
LVHWPGRRIELYIHWRILDMAGLEIEARVVYAMQLAR